MPLVPDLRTSMVRSELLSVLLRSKITKSIGRALLIEETNVFINLFRHIVGVSDVEISEHFGLNPTVNGFHSRII